MISKLVCFSTNNAERPSALSSCCYWKGLETLVHAVYSLRWLCFTKVLFSHLCEYGFVLLNKQNKAESKQSMTPGEGLKAENWMMSGHWHASWRVYFCECTFQFEKHLWKTGFGKNLGCSKFWWGVLFCFNTGFYGFYGILWTYLRSCFRGCKQRRLDSRSLSLYFNHHTISCISWTHYFFT